MGTNYYFYAFPWGGEVALDPVADWKRVYSVQDSDQLLSDLYLSRGDGLHIGKSAMGWTFSLHVFRATAPGGLSICSLHEWVMYWATRPGIIYDEYRTTYSIDRMLEVILNRRQALTAEEMEEISDHESNVLLEYGLLSPTATAWGGREGSKVTRGDGPYDLCWYTFC